MPGGVLVGVQFGMGIKSVNLRVETGEMTNTAILSKEINGDRLVLDSQYSHTECA